MVQHGILRPWGFVNSQGDQLFVSPQWENSDPVAVRTVSFIIRLASGKTVYARLEPQQIEDASAFLFSPIDRQGRTFHWEGGSISFEIRTGEPEPGVVLRTVSSELGNATVPLTFDLIWDIFDLAGYLLLAFSDPTTPLPEFLKPALIADELLKFDSDPSSNIARLAELPDIEIARIMMILAARGGVDIAVSLLERLVTHGRVIDVDAGSIARRCLWEKPEAVTWADLENWSGLRASPRLPEFLAISAESVVSAEYEAFQYIDCFEAAFEDSFETIDFETMDFRDVRARLKKLAEYVDAYFNQVSYPTAESGQLIPYVVGETTMASPNPGFTGVHIDYVTPTWHNEARRALLFAHKICFEDPLDHLIEPIADHVLDRTLTAGSYRLESMPLTGQQLESLRLALVNAQSLSPLIKSGIVIPHALRISRVPQYSRSPDINNIRFRDVTSARYAADWADKIGHMIASGVCDRFRLPEYIIGIFKAAAPSVKDWWWDFFLEIGFDDQLPRNDPLCGWADELYRLALHIRYGDQMGYKPHFTHPHGAQIYALIEAADLAHTASQAFSDAVRSDVVYASRLDARVCPKLGSLSDADLVAIRQQEDLFETWRGMVSSILTKLRNHESDTGSERPELLAKAISEQYADWLHQSREQLTEKHLSSRFEIAEGIAVGLVSGIALGDPISVASLSIGAGYGGIKWLGKFCAWRNERALIDRHYLAIR